MLGMAFALAGDRDWHAFATTQGTRVLYVQLDMPRALFKNSLRGIGESGLVAPSPARMQFTDREILPYPFNILDKGHALMLRRIIQDFGADVVFFDVLRELFRGDEDSSDLMQQAISTAESVCRPAARVFIHHAKKISGDFYVPLMDKFRGSSFLTGAMDAVMFLEERAGKKKDGFNHATLTYKGRAVAETDHHWIQDPTAGYLWRPYESAPSHLQEVLARGGTQAEMARALAILEGIPEETARGRIKRAQESD